MRHIALDRCVRCGRITDTWKFLLRPPRITIDTFIRNIPLCCERCGEQRTTIGVTRQRDAQGYYIWDFCRRTSSLALRVTITGLRTLQHYHGSPTH
jgi:hypothetical protein